MTTIVTQNLHYSLNSTATLTHLNSQLSAGCNEANVLMVLTSIPWRSVPILSSPSEVVPGLMGKMTQEMGQGQASKPATKKYLGQRERGQTRPPPVYNSCHSLCLFLIQQKILDIFV